jgi:hypothetical protein
MAILSDYLHCIPRLWKHRVSRSDLFVVKRIPHESSKSLQFLTEIHQMIARNITFLVWKSWQSRIDGITFEFDFCDPYWIHRITFRKSSSIRQEYCKFLTWLWPSAVFSCLSFWYWYWENISNGRHGNSAFVDR